MRYIDTHCHIDMLSRPEDYLMESERNGNITIGMTNLPSHYKIGKEHFLHLRKSRLALGFHPLLMAEARNEIKIFKDLISQTSYIGEIGLDFSQKGIRSKYTQIEVLNIILEILENKPKIISVHSRKAEATLLQMLVHHSIKNVIFHWYSGDVALIKKIISHGYYFSINESMCLSASGKRIISSIPINRILPETDAPFNKHSDLSNVYSYLENVGCSSSQIENNFKDLMKNLRKDIQ